MKGIAQLTLSGLLAMPAFAQVPPNDQCSGALPSTSGVPFTMSTTGATSVNDPVPTCQPNFGRAVWFTYTPAGNAPVMVSTCGSSFDTVVQIYTGACGALTPLVCNDDNGPGCSGNTASVIFSGTADTTYYIMVGGFGSAIGNLTIVAGVANDSCYAAIPLPYPCSSYVMSTADATSDPGSVPTCQQNFGKGVWFTFSLPFNGTFTLSTCGSTFDTVMQLYEGFCDPEFRFAVACNDDNGPVCSGNNASITFTGRTNYSYYVLVGGYGSAGGTLQVTWDTTPPTIVCPPDVIVQWLTEVPPRPTTLAEFATQGGFASDTCDSALSYQSVDNLAGSGDDLTILRTHTVTDDAGHSASCLQRTTVLDPRTALRIAPFRSSRLRLSWPDYGLNWIVQSTGDLNPPVQWQDEAGEITDLPDGSSYILVEPGEMRRFYRLARSGTWPP